MLVRIYGEQLPEYLNKLEGAWPFSRESLTLEADSTRARDRLEQLVTYERGALPLDLLNVASTIRRSAVIAGYLKGIHHANWLWGQTDAVVMPLSFGDDDVMALTQQTDTLMTAALNYQLWLDQKLKSSNLWHILPRLRSLPNRIRSLRVTIR